MAKMAMALVCTVTSVGKAKTVIPVPKVGKAKIATSVLKTTLASNVGHVFAKTAASAKIGAMILSPVLVILTTLAKAAKISSPANMVFPIMIHILASANAFHALKAGRAMIAIPAMKVTLARIAQAITLPATMAHQVWA